jgi:hypothetical protein
MLEAQKKKAARGQMGGGNSPRKSVNESTGAATQSQRMALLDSVPNFSMADFS